MATILKITEQYKYLEICFSEEEKTTFISIGEEAHERESKFIKITKEGAKCIINHLEHLVKQMD